jgi:cytochrome P450
LESRCQGGFSESILSIIFDSHQEDLARQDADATIRAFYRQKVEERLASESKGHDKDVLSFLKTEIENNTSATTGSSVELLQTLFNGATTTSVSTLLFALYAVSVNSKVEARCLEEIYL